MSFFIKYIEKEMMKLFQQLIQSRTINIIGRILGLSAQCAVIWSSEGSIGDTLRPCIAFSRPLIARFAGPARYLNTDIASIVT